MSCIVDLPIEKITQDADIQIRATSIDWLIVDAYLEAARQGATFPPVIVHWLMTFIEAVLVSVLVPADAADAPARQNAAVMA